MTMNSVHDMFKCMNVKVLCQSVLTNYLFELIDFAVSYILDIQR